jgi:hypothetical protein
MMPVILKPRETEGPKAGYRTNIKRMSMLIECPDFGGKTKVHKWWKIKRMNGDTKRNVLPENYILRKEKQTLEGSCN